MFNIGVNIRNVIPSLPAFRKYTESSFSLVFTHSIPSKTPIYAHADRKDMFGLYTSQVGSLFKAHRVTSRLLLLTCTPKTA